MADFLGEPERTEIEYGSAREWLTNAGQLCVAIVETVAGGDECPIFSGLNIVPFLSLPSSSSISTSLKSSISDVAWDDSLLVFLKSALTDGVCGLMFLED